MEQPTKKLFRGNDYSDLEEGQLSGAARSNAFISNVDTDTFPDEVAYCFLSGLRNVELLKTCRLVCTSWDIVASRSLRMCSVVILKEDDPRLTDFNALLIKRSFGPLRHLQPPFKNFHAKGQKFTDTVFINLVLQPNINISSLELCKLKPNVDQSELSRVLAANKTSITDLIISGDSERFVLKQALFARNEINLTALKFLRLREFCHAIECSHIPFIENVLSTSTPETIDLSISQGELVVSLLPQERIKNVKHLSLHFNEFSLAALEHLSKLVFSRLTTLYLGFDNPPEDFMDDVSTLLKFFQNVSPFVVDLTMHVLISSASSLFFPRLKIISLENNNVLSFLTPDNFPSLSKVVYFHAYPLLDKLQNLVTAHHGVHSFVIDMKYTDMEDETDHEVMILMNYVSRQFPSVTSLEFSIQEFHCTTLSDICELFPKLTTLRLNGQCDFFAFSGMLNSMVTSYLALGWPIEDILRRKSIVDLLELQFISFGDEFVLEPDVLIHCLARIPKLKHIEFHWNDSLSAPLLRDSVGHLEKIVVLNSSKSECKAAMAEASEMLPNVYLR